MKLRKNFWVCIVCILLVFGIAIAEELNPSLSILAVLESEGTLKTVVYTTVEGNLQPSDFDAKLDGEPVSISEIPSLNRSEQLGSTYLFVIDMPNNKADLDKMKSLAKALVNQAGPNDNFGVMGIDSVASKTSLTSSKDSAANAVEQIEFSRSPNATFNTTIVEAMECLNTSAQVKTRKCLVILSTCETKNKTVGATDSVVESKVKEKIYSIYSVTLFAEKDISKERASRASYLSSLTKLSKGGLAISATGKNDDQVITAFSQNEKRFFVLTIAPNQLFWKEPKNLSLSITDNAHILSDSIAIGDDVRAAFANLPTLTPASTPGGSVFPEQPTVTPTPPPPPPPPITLEVLLFCGAGLILLVLVIILITMTVKNKKKRQRISESTNPVPPDIVNDNGAGKTEVDDQPRVRITLVGIGESANKNFKMDVRDGILIGRDNEQARIRLDYDKKVSRRHALITYSGGFMRIEDLNSQNGTRINQEPDKITSSRVLNQNDTFRVGRSEFRVDWSVE